LSLRISGLSKTYPNGVRALQDLTLTIGNNMFGLLGPNGAGKSTLMRTIATLQEPDSGEIWLDDINVLKDKDAVRRILGYLPQEFGVYPKVSALDLLNHLAIMKGIRAAGERKDSVEALLQQTNLWDVRKKSLSSYSGGMKQRFGIAQALLASPRLIIVDDVKELCPRMAIIAGGKLLLEGSPAESLELLRGRIWSKIVTSPSELTDIEKSFDLVSTHLTAGRHQVRVYSEQPLDEGFSPADINLEDVYFHNLKHHQKAA
jgi:ABC-2 type transport system ATP-binding protein